MDSELGSLQQFRIDVGVLGWSPKPSTNLNSLTKLALERIRKLREALKEPTFQDWLWVDIPGCAYSTSTCLCSSIPECIYAS